MIEWITDKCKDIKYWFKDQYRMMGRILFWGWKMRYSWDFDAGTIYEILYYKLDRIYDSCKDYGNCVWDDNPNSNLMRKLKEASILAKRLYEDDYELRAIEEANERFGNLCWSEPAAELFRKGRNKIYMAQRRDEKARFFKLLSQYIDVWWD